MAGSAPMHAILAMSEVVRRPGQTCDDSPWFTSSYRYEVNAVLDFLAANPLLTVFGVVACGTLVGAIPFGPLRLGSAGGLFVGLAVGALDARLSENVHQLQTFGLALFVYTVGLAVGYTFFTTLKRQAWILLASAGVLAISVGVSIGVGRLLGLSAPMVAGAYAGATTTSPALAAATQAAGNTIPSVGNALSYPVGVIVTMLTLVIVTAVPLPSRRDPEPVTSGTLCARSVEVTRHTPLEDVPGWKAQLIQGSYFVRDGAGCVISDGATLMPGDRILLIGTPATLEPAIDFLGHESDVELTDNRQDVDHRRVTVSNPEIAGRTLAEIDLPGRFGGRVTRVFRGDTQILAHDDLSLALGDRVLVVLPAGRLNHAAGIFGDSERRISEIDPLSLGIGMALGIGLGTIAMPLGSASLSLGAAGGPLVMGMLLGRVRRTGNLVWELPHSANLTLRQLGLTMFLTCVGLASGPAFAGTAFSLTGIAVGALAAVIAGTIALLMWAAAILLGLSTGRAAGLVAGSIGQPALLAYAQSRVADERVEAGYSTIFAVGMVAKTIIAYLIASAW